MVVIGVVDCWRLVCRFVCMFVLVLIVLFVFACSRLLVVWCWSCVVGVCLVFCVLFVSGLMCVCVCVWCCLGVVGCADVGECCFVHLCG